MKVKPKTISLRNGNLLTIREAEPNDAKELLSFLNIIGGESDFLTLGKGEFTLTMQEEKDFLESCRLANNQIYLLGIIQGQIIGTLHLEASHRARVRHSGEIGMSILKTYWGLGIGGHLLDVLIDWAKQTGVIRKINLRVRTDNDRAIRLYKGKGFVLEGTLSNEMFVAGQYYDLYAMGLNL
jgi:RimJ/RimL family protein N-acetyltransferase